MDKSIQINNLQQILGTYQKLPTLAESLRDIQVIKRKGILTRILWNKYHRIIAVYPLRYMGEPASSVENDFKYTLLHIFCPIRESDEFKKLCGMFCVDNIDPCTKRNKLFDHWWRMKIRLQWEENHYGNS